MKGNCWECESRWTCDIEPEECDQWPEPVPMTNGDRMRTMTDGELAEQLAEARMSGTTLRLDDSGPTGVEREFLKNRIERAYLNWLRQPYKEKEHGQTIGADTEA